MIRVVTYRPEAFQDVGWHEFADLEEVFEELADKEEIGFDSETTSLSCMSGELICIQLGGYGTDYVIDIHPEFQPITLFKKFLESKTLVGHNLSFDLTFLYKHGILPTKLWDTFLAEKNLSLGIDSYGCRYNDVVERYCGVILSKEMQKRIAQTGLLDVEAIEYSGNDTKYILDVKNKQLPKCDKWEITRAVKLDSAFARVTAYIEYCGVYLNQEKWYKVARQHEHEEWLHMLNLKQWLKDNDLPDMEYEAFKSPAQIEPFMREVLNIDTYDSKSKKNTVDAKHLSKIKHPFVELYLNFKGAQKQVNTYGRNWFEYPYDDKRIHTKYGIIKDTGRTSSGQVRKGPWPNMQNVPQKDIVRACFEGQGPNRLIICDYSQQENVVMAEKSGEKNLVELIETGADMHCYVARQIWPDLLGHLSDSEIKKQFPKQRGIAKSAGFAIQFGGNGYTIAHNVNIPVKEGDRVYDAYMKAFPDMAKYFQKVHKEALSKGYIEINKVTGRKRFLFGYKDYVRGGRTDTRFENTVYRLSLNTPVQGTAADMSKLAGIFILDWIIKEKRFGKTKIVNFVHDEYNIEDHVKRCDRVAPVISELMEKAAKVFMKKLIIKAEPEISKVWKK